MGEGVRIGRRPCALAEGRIGTVRVIVLHVLGESDLEVSTPEDEQNVQALAPNRAHKTFGDRVRSWRSDRSLDDSDALGSEHGVIGSGELRVSVTDEGLDCLGLLIERHAEVPGLLGHPAGDGTGGDAGDPDEARVAVNEEEYIEPPEEDGVDGKEVAGEQSARQLHGAPSAVVPPAT
jgi:hypothetical protein